MPDTRSLIESARNNGIILSLVDDKVRVQLAGTPDGEMRTLVEELRRYKAEIKSILEEDDPVLLPDQWYPHFREFHHKVVSETRDFDYGELRKRQPNLYSRIKDKENEIDAFETGRLSDVIAVMRDWRELILKAYFEDRQGAVRRAAGNE
jgi:hypothetical protein